MCAPHFVYPLAVEGHLGCFSFGLVDSAAVTIHVQVFRGLVSITWGTYLGVDMLGHWVILCLQF